jgi:hypothetical protein
MCAFKSTTSLPGTQGRTALASSTHGSHVPVGNPRTSVHHAWRPWNKCGVSSRVPLLLSVLKMRGVIHISHRQPQLRSDLQPPISSVRGARLRAAYIMYHAYVHHNLGPVVC